MKKKGKVNPRDVPKTKLISEKKEDTNPMKISRLRNKILEKLRKLLDR